MSGIYNETLNGKEIPDSTLDPEERNEKYRAQAQMEGDRAAKENFDQFLDLGFGQLSIGDNNDPKSLQQTAPSHTENDFVSVVLKTIAVGAFTALPAFAVQAGVHLLTYNAWASTSPLLYGATTVLSPIPVFASIGGLVNAYSKPDHIAKRQKSFLEGAILGSTIGGCSIISEFAIGLLLTVKSVIQGAAVPFLVLPSTKKGTQAVKKIIEPAVKALNPLIEPITKVVSPVIEPLSSRIQSAAKPLHLVYHQTAKTIVQKTRSETDQLFEKVTRPILKARSSILAHRAH